MASEGTSIKTRTSRLAVFEHIVQKPKSPKNKRNYRANYSDSSNSESELVINELEDDYRPPARKKKRISLKDEILNLVCYWNGCLQNYTEYDSFLIHLSDHLHCLDLDLDGHCLWRDCTWKNDSNFLLLQHIAYHGYLMRLINLGKNVVERNNLPPCLITGSFSFPDKPDGYRCEWEHCSDWFISLPDISAHMRMHVNSHPRLATDEEPIICLWKGCNLSLVNQHRLGEHIRTHTGAKAIGCPTCNNLFSTRAKFLDHRIRQINKDLQSYQCSQCLKLFASENILREHMRLHINSYKCTMCNMTCAKPSLLAKHMRYRHIKDKFYKCDQCGKSFIESYTLLNHVKRHKNENSFKCNSCDVSFRTNRGLYRHNIKEHNQAPSVYQCHCCKKPFARGDYLTKHLMKVHNFHWPSGHSRFRYRQDPDGIYRLQTVRYESLEVTQEMIRSESNPTEAAAAPTDFKLSERIDNDMFNIRIESVTADNDSKVTISVIDESAGSENSVLDKTVMITLNDLDHDGNIVKTEVIESTALVCDDKQIKDE